MKEERRIQDVIDKFYEIISGKAGHERNWVQFKSLFYGKDSLLTSMKFDLEKNCVTKPVVVDSYIIGLNNFLMANDFYEYGHNYKIRVFGSIAEVHSEYAAKRRKEADEIIKQGVNLVQLIYDGQTWKIHSMLWQDKL